MGFPYNSNSSYYSPQPMFPQPNGNVYIIQNSLEVANIPAGAGITLALCLGENLLYIKSMQNGIPSFLAYKLTPYTNDVSPQQQPANEASNLETRVSVIEQKLNTILGGANNDVSNAAATARKPTPTEWET